MFIVNYHCVREPPETAHKSRNSHTTDMDAGERLLGVASSLKNDVKTIQSKLHTHELLIEAIDASNAENVVVMNEGNNRIEQAISTMRKDPRNKIIFALVLVTIVLTIYFFRF